MTEEFRHHLELRTEDLIRRGFPPRKRLAGPTSSSATSTTIRTMRDPPAGWGYSTGSAPRRSISRGLRMLMKYPGLSLVSVIGMSVAIAIGAGAFGSISSWLDPTLPLDEGERVVSLQNSNLRNIGNPDRQSLHDFAVWRDELTSVTDLGAFMSDRRNLVTAT